MLKVVRLDERLVHGQVVNNWCSSEDITEIIVIDKNVVRDEIRKTFIEMAVPEDIEVLFCDVDGAIKIYEEESKYENLMIIFSNPFEILEFLEKGGNISKVNIGGLPYKAGKKRISTAVYLNESEIEVLKKIAKKNVSLDVRMLPNDRSINILTLLQSKEE
ncbi:PTS system mannose/fructose/N-acetylgalactosamine-transporter subunit IIB [Thermoanaerobacterium butyriciformans]|uniref:Mannose/fructose/N-acetylgalactosamine-specific phosphotransferase system component IIB n=1 Tax=Thermoanaerobacterium butyriciformans TaxID=1702242 RepID=A0ABS4NH40_9THEO|nr:PTS sugar transporter subunit IIB [Thermoanaerobacterium butyriciformans]MBP2072990.1 mannose/fructose/N-acetylgalactosamine-specific phosphotransferase system component IIB [Thermoanaerobacterium butyriciformans]